MPATADLPRATRGDENARRTAAIRARCASASPRIRYQAIADEAGLSVGTVKNVLSDNAPWDVRDALAKIEAALDTLTASPEEAQTEGA